MPTLRENVLALIRSTPGLNDREITDRLLGAGSAQQGVNQIARALASGHLTARRVRDDGKLGNYPDEAAQESSLAGKANTMAMAIDLLSEDDVKRKLKVWLEAGRWKVTVAWGRGSLDPMRVSYFLGVIGELLQRMNDADAKYSIALPDLPQFRRLWGRLPELAKQRTGISVLFVNDSGRVEEVA